MAERQKLDYSVRQAIVKLHKEKHTIREISEKVKRSRSVVGRVVKSYNDTGNIVSAFKTGRPRKTSAREDRIMLCMSLKDRFKSCTEIKRVMNSTSCVNVSRQTVSRRLQEIGRFNRTPWKKPLVSSKNKINIFANRSNPTAETEAEKPEVETPKKTDVDSETKDEKCDKSDKVNNSEKADEEEESKSESGAEEEDEDGSDKEKEETNKENDEKENGDDVVSPRKRGPEDVIKDDMSPSKKTKTAESEEEKKEVVEPES